jgi:ribonuclease HI
MKKKNNFYVVWVGHKTGVFNSWDECKEYVQGFKDARYMGFETQEKADTAFKEGYELHKKLAKKPQKLISSDVPLKRAVCVDAACSVEKQIMEYRGVFFETNKVLFHRGPYDGGSNNIGEFLAIVHAMAYMKKNKIFYPIYTDSMTALSWIDKKNVNTKIQPGEQVKVLIEKAVEWLQKNTTQYTILKWNTASWGEIPADFGRK